MRIAGIDPGYAIVGYGAIEYDGNRFRAGEYGAVTTEAGTPFVHRLMQIENELSAFFARSRPEALAVEKLYFTNNKTTGIDVAQARGVILLCAGRAGIPVFEYTPMQVKMAVVGYGKAEKKQVMEMTRMILGLQRIPRPDDTADALAVAICHAHTAASAMGRIYAQSRR